MCSNRALALLLCSLILPHFVNFEDVKVDTCFKFTYVVYPVSHLLSKLKKNENNTVHLSQISLSFDNYQKKSSLESENWQS